MTLFLLLLHGISALLLLGALTHQALAVWAPRPASRSGWWSSLRAVHAGRYVGAVIVLFVASALLGACLYPGFRVVTRLEFLDAQRPWATGLFEIKEHAVGLGLALLPAYWGVWREAGAPGARRAITTLLGLIAWTSFLAGHVVNNVRGL